MWYNIGKTEQVPVRKYIHALPYLRSMLWLYRHLRFYASFNVYRFRTERRVIYTFAIDTAMREKNYRKNDAHPLIQDEYDIAVH